MVILVMVIDDGEDGGESLQCTGGEVDDGYNDGHIIIFSDALASLALIIVTDSLTRRNWI